MASTSQIIERISFYENKIIEYQKNQKYAHRLQTSESLLNFWKNQLSKQQKSNGRSGNKNI